MVGYAPQNMVIATNEIQWDSLNLMSMPLLYLNKADNPRLST